MQYESLLFAAINSPLGIIVQTSDPERLRQKLYPLRKANPAFSCLHFVIPPTNSGTRLWVVKKPEA